VAQYAKQLRHVEGSEQTENQWFNNNKSSYSNFPGPNVRTILTGSRTSAILRAAIEPCLAKSFPFTDRYSLRLRWEAFNITNTPIRRARYNFNNATFGQLPKLQNNFPRVMQIGEVLLQSHRHRQ
jgi:hypothetical protein